MIQELTSAVEANDAHTVKTLIEQDPTLLNTRDGAGNSPLITAVYHGSHDVAQLLLTIGADLSVHEAAALGRVEALGSSLEAQPSLLNSYSHDGWTPLHLAAFFGQADAVRLLIGRRADIHARSRNSMENTPLHAAVASGQRKAAGILIQNGADVNAVARGWAPLHLAAQNGNTEIIRLLLTAGAEVTPQREGRPAPLAMAAEQGHTLATDLLREHGATD